MRGAATSLHTSTCSDVTPKTSTTGQTGSLKPNKANSSQPHRLNGCQEEFHQGKLILLSSTGLPVN